MRALVVHDWTTFENLRVEDDWRSPPIEPGSVRIRTQAVGVNFALSLRVEGKYQVRPPLPHVPGNEICGVVTEIGEGVAGFAIGDRVASFVMQGAYADECIAPAHQTFGLPDSVEFCRAVGLASSYMTAYAALVWPQWIALRSGETLLVHGAAGGVGLAAIEIAKILGARVIATCGSAKKAEVCRRHGADHVIDYSEADFKPAVLEITDRAGVDAVFDPVGGDVFSRSLSCLKPEGRIMPVGFASGEVPQIPANILLVKSIKVLGMNYGYYSGQVGGDPARRKDMSKVFEPQVRSSMDQILRWVDQGRVNPEISHVFPFSRRNDAMATVLGKQAIGRVAIVFDEEAARLGFS